MVNSEAERGRSARSRCRLTTLNSASVRAQQALQNPNARPCVAPFLAWPDSDLIVAEPWLYAWPKGNAQRLQSPPLGPAMSTKKQSKEGKGSE